MKAGIIKRDKIEGDNITRTYRIWQRSPYPERLPFFWEGMKIYASDKKRIWCINKVRIIRNRWWRVSRHSNSTLCKSVTRHRRGQNGQDSIDEYFNVRYRKADYTEFFD